MSRKWNPGTKSTAELLDERGHNDDQTSSAEKDLQSKAFSSIVDILIDAGYFRARIATLSEFDKAVGGLCWCITSSGVNVDVDILFNENSTIGEKVQLSEKIIKVMRSMHCPHPLQANQVQGSDWANVLPVIAWLVQKFFENRTLTQKQLRLFAFHQFGKHYALPHEDRDPRTDSGLPDVMARYKAQRRFKLAQQTVQDSTSGGQVKNTEESKVHRALLEYGETLKSRYGLGGSEEESKAGAAATAVGPAALTFGVGGLDGGTTEGGKQQQQQQQQPMSAFDRKLAAAAKKAAAAEAELAKEMEKEEGELLEGVEQLGRDAGMASSKRVGSIVGMGTSEIAAAAARYELSVEEARRKVEESMHGGQEGGSGVGGMAGGEAASYRRQKAVLEKRKLALAPKLSELSGAKVAGEQALAAKQGEVAQRVQANVQAAEEAEKLSKAEQESGMASELAKLKGLVLLNEQLKQQEVSYKANVKRQLANLKAQQAAADNAASVAAGAAGAGAADQEEARIQEIEAMHLKVMAKYGRLRSLLAERNLSLSSSSRAIDDVPTRTELIQYERRFTELYQQVALKLSENKKYFEMYNTLDETHRMLSKEVTLLNSITDNFDAAMASKATKETFQAQLTSIIKSTEESLASKKAALQGKDARLETLTTAHHSLVEEQRRYFKAVKDFQEECNKNEAYAAKFEEMQSQSQQQAKDEEEAGV